MRLPLLALALASFGIGTTEFVIMGLLPQLAQDLGVSIPGAGLLVSGYALGVVVGAPILAVATARLPRRIALLGLMGIFIVGNALCALAPGYGWLMAARVLTAFCHGAFFGVGAVVAADLVAPDKRASAIAMMFTGLTLANVLGVPAGTALGQALGWRATFWAVVVIGLVAAAALWIWLPKGLAAARGNLRGELRALGRKQVLLAMLISTLASASLFSVFTYVSPMLQQVSGITEHGVTLVLLLFGVGLTLGNIAGGKLADWRLMPSVIGLFAATVLVLLAFGATLALPAAAVAGLFVWGVLAFALVSPLQMRVVLEARGAPNLASTVNQAAFNLGNAAGAWVSGVALDQGVPYGTLPAIGAVIAAIAGGFALWSYRLDRTSDWMKASFATTAEDSTKG
jgi:DHA1 family inner membrane transport protein